MIKVRIKIKHLLFLVVCIAAAIYFVIPNLLFFGAEAIQKKNLDVSKLLYKKYLDSSPYGAKRDEALYKLAQSILPEGYNVGRYKLFTDGSASWVSTTSDEVVENAANYYEEIVIEHKDSPYYPKAYKCLLEIYTANGSLNEVKQLITEGVNSGEKDIRLIALKYKMYYLLGDRGYDEVRTIANNLFDEGIKDSDIYMLLGDAYFYEGKTEQALSYYEKAQKLPFSRAFYSDYEDAGSYERVALAKRVLGGYSGDGSIYGRVVINGKPVPYAYIYLKDKELTRSLSIGNESLGIIVFTDSRGTYRINNIPRGDYVLGVGIPMASLKETIYQTPAEGFIHLNQGESKKYDFTFVPTMTVKEPQGTISHSDNKVTVSWDAVKGAAYYHVKMIVFEKPGKFEGSSGSIVVGEQITRTQYTLDIAQENRKRSGIMSDGEGRVNPQAYLGAFFPGSKVPIYVEAYDKDGALITGSKPVRADYKYITQVTVPETALTPSDRLVLEGKMKEALKSYENDIKNNPEDIHALSVLSRIYWIGTKTKYGLENAQAEDQDLMKAAALNRKLFDITGDLFYLKESLKQRHEQGNDSESVLAGYQTIPEEALDAEDYTIIAELCLKLKKYKEADQYYDKIYSTHKDTNWYDLKPVVLRLYLKEYDRSLEFLKVVSLGVYGIDKDAFIDRVKAITKKEGESLQGYPTFEEALTITLEGIKSKEDREKFQKAYEDIDDPILKDILKMVGEYYSVFSEYN